MITAGICVQDLLTQCGVLSSRQHFKELPYILGIDQPHHHQPDAGGLAEGVLAALLQVSTEDEAWHANCPARLMLCNAVAFSL